MVFTYVQYQNFDDILVMQFEMAKDYLTPTIGGTIVDASCGSGLFSRLFAESGMYSLVVALDFSENMLLQCDEFIKQKGISKELVLFFPHKLMFLFINGDC